MIHCITFNTQSASAGQRHRHVVRFRVTGVLLFLAFVLTASTSFAEVLYVGPNGSDNRSRSQATNRSTPVRSISRGLQLAGAGDTVVVLDGTYYGLVYIAKSGRRGSPLVLKSENKHGAKLIGSIQSDDQSYLVVDGFDVSNRQASNFGTKGIRLDRCHHITVRNNRVHDCIGGGINSDQSDWILIEWNIVHHNAFLDANQHSGISVYQPQYRADDNGTFGVIIRNNTCYANENKLNNPLFGRPTDGNGIVVDDFKNISPGGNGVLYERQALITNNFCFLNGGQGIHCYRAHRIFVRNNTCYKNMKSFDFGGEVSVSESDQCFVYNNVLFAREGKNIALQFDSTRVWWDYNVMFNGSLFQVNAGPNTRFAHPLFQPGSLRLRSFSPAINLGLTHANVYPVDVDGQPRVIGNRIDAGAKEFNPGFDE
ncbi:MAG: right-handed parallel beta-helix repeat-containing protein [Planctomycetota bacterium]